MTLHFTAENTTKVTIQPGARLDIEIEGLGVIYTVLTQASHEPMPMESVGVTVIDRANDTVIDVNEFPLEES